MRFPFTTEPATFVERPNRYVVVAELGSGEVVRAHCPDPGRLKELLLPGVRVHVSSAPREGRRTTHELRFVEHPETGVLISLDSRLPNALFREALEARSLEPFAHWTCYAREAASPLADGPVRSRVDFVLTDEAGTRTWVEVKSATLVVGRCAYFPDAVTERGRRHVLEMIELTRMGDRCAVCFLVQRPDAHMLRPQWDRDPAFAHALHDAEQAGVELVAYSADVALDEAAIRDRIPVVTAPGA
jgi:sugar fermentation stimulation protein A